MLSVIKDRQLKLKSFSCEKDGRVCFVRQEKRDDPN